MHKNIIKLDELYTGVCSTDTALEALRKAIHEHKIDIYSITYAHIEYDASVGIGLRKSAKFYPLKVGNNVFTLWIPYVTSGYRGEGPCGMIEALRMLGFDIDYAKETMIFSIKHLDVNLYKDT